MTGPMEIARKYFSEWEAKVSSTFKELLEVCCCLQSMVHRCEGRLVVLYVNAMNLIGIVNLPRQPEARHQRVGEGDILVLFAPHNHHFGGMGAHGGECLRG